jgi:integrase
MAVYKDKERGTWFASFLYEDWTGKRCRKLKRGFATKKEALDWEMHFKLQKASSLDMTFEDFCKVYEQDVKPKVRYNTWCTKKHIIETKLLPYFKDMTMRDIEPRDILQWQNAMREKCTKGGTEYAGTYLKTLQAQLSCIFNHAVRFYSLPKNPVRIAGAMGQHEADEMLFWTKEEYMQFIPTMANKTYSYMAFELLYWCGIRLGELLALTPADFDFEKNTLSITKSYQRLRGEDVITNPKTKKSIRKVVMPDTVAKEMKDFIDSIYGLEADDRIFPISKSYLHHEMDRGVKECGVKRIRIHDLRHSHVSLLIDMGFSAVAIGNRVGHESEKITYRYAHLFPSVQGEMAEALDAEWKEGFYVGEENGQ